jgi:hypothetical protein
VTRDLRLFPLVVIGFVVLATLNSAGYRFGASDQAFYIPAILDRIEPSLYPRDSDLIASQARLTFVDETVAPLARVTGMPLPWLCAALYVLSLALLVWGASGIASALFRTEWTAVAFLTALTLRHAIIDSGTNTLEGYFHPRQLAFGLGAIGMATFMRRGGILGFLPLACAVLLHPTTALWLLIWLAVAVFFAEPGLRRPLVIAAAGALLIGAWMVTAGPLAGRLTTMDAEWLATLHTKEYLFPLTWPASVWLVNLGYVPIIIIGYLYRRRARLLVQRETALVIGCLSLLGVFAAALALHTQPVALAVQLQPARIFWMLDFLATAYVVWALVEGTVPSTRRLVLTASVLVLASASRGAYIGWILFPGRPMAEIDVPDTDWGRAMAWARASDPASGWLADPVHAARYGSSLRVAGERDVLVEEIKDTAIGLYDRTIAIRTRDRLAALGDFGSLTAEQARAIGDRYGLDYLITEQTLGLPVAFASGTLRVYRLR